LYYRHYQNISLLLYLPSDKSAAPKKAEHDWKAHKRIHTHRKSCHVKEDAVAGERVVEIAGEGVCENLTTVDRAR